jgi:hypothetical protein
VNFIAFKLGSPQCFSTYDYIDEMMVETLGPLIIIILVLLAYFCNVSIFARGRNSDPNWVRSVTARYITFFFLITYLVLPGVTTKIFGIFTCVDVDPNGLMPGVPKFLLLDMSIACTGANNGRYRFGVIWAAVMIVVYPVGVLAFYFYTLYHNRFDIVEKDLTGLELEILLEEEARERQEYMDAHDGSDEGFVMTGRQPPSKGVMKFVTASELSFLHRAYEGRCWYWEVVETGRRLLLTAVVSVVGTGSGSQIVFGIFIAILFIKLYSYYQPYVQVRTISTIALFVQPFTLKLPSRSLQQDDDDFLQEVAQYQVFFTLFIALLIRDSKYITAFTFA